MCRRKTPVKNKQADARETVKRARVEYDDDNACTSALSKLLRNSESVSGVSQCNALDESVISFVDVLRKPVPVTVVDEVVYSTCAIGSAHSTRAVISRTMLK